MDSDELLAALEKWMNPDPDPPDPRFQPTDCDRRPTIDVHCDHCRRNSPHGAPVLIHMVWEAFTPKSTPEWRAAMLTRVSASKRPTGGLVADGSYMYGPRHEITVRDGLPEVRNHRGVYAPLPITPAGRIEIKCRGCGRARKTSWSKLRARAKAAADSGRRVVAL